MMPRAKSASVRRQVVVFEQARERLDAADALSQAVLILVGRNLQQHCVDKATVALLDGWPPAAGAGAPPPAKRATRAAIAASPRLPHSCAGSEGWHPASGRVLCAGRNNNRTRRHAAQLSRSSAPQSLSIVGGRGHLPASRLPRADSLGQRVATRNRGFAPLNRFSAIVAVFQSF